MNRAAILSFDVADIKGLAASWARAGLTANYLAVDLADMPGEDAEADHPWQGELVSEDGISEPAPVTRLLADARPDRVDLVCIRGTNGTAGRPAAMANLVNHVRTRAGGDGQVIRVTAVDLVFPLEADETGPLGTDQEVVTYALPESVGGYQRVILSPEDSAAPGETDVGIGDELSRAGVALHAALTLLGVQGGVWAEPAMPDTADLDRPVVMRAYTRGVAGGRLCHDETARFVVDGLFTSSRADTEPEGYRQVPGERGRELAASAVESFRRKWRGVATYLPAAPAEWTQPPNLGPGKHLVLILRFVPWALGEAARGWSGSARTRATAPIADLLESEDLGYEVGQRFVQDPASWTSWSATDQGMAEVARRAVGEAEQLPAGQLNHQMWIDLARFSTGLCDGGELPFDLPGIESDNRRRLILPSNLVSERLEESAEPAAALLLPMDRDPRAEGSEESNVTEIHASVKRELEDAESIRPGVFAAALRMAFADGSGLDQNASAASRVVRTAQALQRDEDEDRGRWQAECRQAVRCEAAPNAHGVLSGLRARTIADLLTATTDSMRWSTVAQANTRIDVEPLRQQLGRFSRSTALLLGGGMGFGLVWWWRGGWVTGWINRMTGVDLPAAAIAAGVVIALLAVFMVTVVKLFRVFSAAAEQARRLMEARSRALFAARESLRERNRLRSVDRIMALWSQILSWSIAGDLRDPQAFGSPLTDPMAVNRPVALQLARPVTEERERKKMLWALRSEATAPGWRRDWLDDLLLATGEFPEGEGLDSTSPESVALLAGDDGSGQTRLRRVSGAVSEVPPRADVTRRWIERLDDALALSYFADHKCAVATPFLTRHEQETNLVGEWLKPLHTQASIRHLFTPSTPSGEAPPMVLAGYPHPPEDGDGRVIDIERARGVTSLQSRCDIFQVSGLSDLKIEVQVKPAQPPSEAEDRGRRA